MKGAHELPIEGAAEYLPPRLCKEPVDLPGTFNPIGGGFSCKAGGLISTLSAPSFPSGNLLGTGTRMENTKADWGVRGYMRLVLQVASLYGFVKCTRVQRVNQRTIPQFCPPPHLCFDTSSYEGLIFGLLSEMCFLSMGSSSKGEF